MIERINRKPENSASNFKQKDKPIFGIRAVSEAIQSGQSIDKIFIQHEAGGALMKELEKLAKQFEVPVQRVPKKKLEFYARGVHQGVVAFISPVPFQKIEDLLQNTFEAGKNPFFLALDGVTDTRNLGAIIRTANCAGVDALLFPEKRSAAINQDTIKTSAGGIFHLPLCKTHSLRASIKYLKNSGLKIYAASEKGETPYHKIDFTQPIALIMGGEDEGVSEEILKICDGIISIPMYGEIASLNVSVACGILLFEVAKQRENEK